MILVIPLALTLHYILHREGLRAALPGLAAMTGALLITAAPMASVGAHQQRRIHVAGRMRVGIIQNGWLTAEVARQQLPHGAFCWNSSFGTRYLQSPTIRS